MKNKKVLLLVLATVLMLGLAVVAVVTSLKLRELSTVPVAPNVPVSQPRAQAAPVCQVSFTVAETTLSELACTVKNAYKTSISTANKLAAGAEVSRGDTIVYEIGYENTGDAAGTITLTDVLSDKVEFVSADTPCTYATATKTVTCSAVSVAAGASGTKKITVKVLDTAAAGTFNNSAVVTPSEGDASTCSISLNLTVTTNSELACTVKSAYKTSISTANKLAAGAEVARGDTIVYEIGYENTGDGAGTVTITDVLSDKLEFVSADTPCTYAAATRTVTCSNVSVAAGATGSKKITVKVLATATAGEIGNSALVTPSEGEASTCAIDLALKVSTSTPTPSPTPGPTAKPPACNDYCANDGECPSGLTCSWNKCRNPECLDDNDCSCEQPPGCNEVCNPDNLTNECVGGYICDRSTNTCRNSACTGEADCTCEIQGIRVTTQETLPEAGSPIPGFLFLGVGALLLILGVLVVGL
jgi:fimbrial isopeptide formation D2 family protein/uncharacterized repeat protein (TIGR01451 family)